MIYSRADPAETEMGVSVFKHARKTSVAAPYQSRARKDPRLSELHRPVEIATQNGHSALVTVSGVTIIKRLTLIAIAFLTLTCLVETAWSKGAITKIVIDGVSLSAPVVIIDPEILDRFTIWSGPGVVGWDMLGTIPPAGTAKFICDWTLSVPKAREIFPDQHAYLVTFYIEGRAPPKDTYEVAYEVDNKVPRGYVYLPSYPSDDFGQWNTFQISRGVEGSWFYATKEWDEVVRPLMGKE